LAWKSHRSTPPGQISVLTITTISVSTTFQTHIAVYLCNCYKLTFFQHTEHNTASILPNIKLICDRCAQNNNKAVFSALIRHNFLCIECLSQDRINWEGCGKKGIRLKMGDDGRELLISPHGVALAGLSACLPLP